MNVFSRINIFKQNLTVTTFLKYMSTDDYTKLFDAQFLKRIRAYDNNGTLKDLFNNINKIC